MSQRAGSITIRPAVSAAATDRRLGRPKRMSVTLPPDARVLAGVFPRVNAAAAQGRDERTSQRQLG